MIRLLPKEPPLETNRINWTGIAMYRPHLHTSLARTVYQRIQSDNQMKDFDKNIWYSADMSLLSNEVQNSFTQFFCDSETEFFLENCHDKADSIITQIFHAIVSTFLSAFMTRTSINGLLDRGSMFVFSHLQFEKLMDIPSSWRGEHFLDLGAGDGKVTEIMSSYFRHTYVTEASITMRRLLFKKNFKLLEIDDWPNADIKFDAISCLNLLDRCERPKSLLRQMAVKLKPGSGRLIIAIVIPFVPYVEFGTNGSTKPIERFQIFGKTFEEQVVSLIDNEFSPAGLEVIRWSKVPYLCEGNLRSSFYHLTDSVFVLKVKPEFERSSESVSYTCSNGEGLHRKSVVKCSSTVVDMI